MQKTILLIFMVFLSQFSILNAQDNTYLKNLYGLENICQVIEDENEILFVLSEVGELQAKITKINSKGDYVAETEVFTSRPFRFKPTYFAMLNDSKLICINVDYNTHEVSFKVFNKECEYLEDLNFPELNGWRIIKIISNNDNIVLYLKSDDNYSSIAYLSEWPTIDWIKKFEFMNSSNLDNAVSLNKNGEVLSVISNSNLLLFNSVGDTLINETGSYARVSNISNEGFYLIPSTVLMRYDFATGLIFKQLPMLNTNVDLIQISGERLVILRDYFGITYSTIYNKDLEVINNIEVYNEYLNINPFTESDYLYYFRNKQNSGVIQKIHPDGNNDFVNISYDQSQIYQPGSSLEISLLSNNFDEIDLYYSSDKVSWKQIEEHISEEMWNYFWNIPAGYEQIHLMARASNKPSVTDISFAPIHVAPTINKADFIEANKVKMWNSAGGQGSHDPDHDDGGLYWDGTPEPQITSVFADGPVFGFKSFDEIKVYSAGYHAGFVPGVINDDGTFTPPGMEAYHVYQISKDWQDLPSSEEKVKFEYSYNNWPGEIGAPFHDEEDNNTYDPPLDRPAFSGERTIWFANHTNDSTTTAKMFGSYGDKMEIHTKIWAENTQFPDVVYKEYTFINKDEHPFNDFYFGYWSDPDLGYAVDDFAGVDSALDLAYCYNGDDYDDFLYLSNPAAMGYMLLDGPIIPATPDDTARYRGELRPGYKNLPSTSFAFYVNGETFYNDPHYANADGAVEIYNNLLGLNFQGKPYEVPGTSDITKFPLSGDPVASIGWYEGDGWSGGGVAPGDRRILLSSGPFELAPTDTQSVIIAILLARDSSPEGSVNKLKNLAKSLKNNWLSGQITNMGNNSNFVPEEYLLAQNYPNPFNPSTVIEFSLPEQANVQLEVFNILGEKVADLVNTEMQPGVHKVDFNGEGLASGLYIYRLTAGDVNLVRKMMLLK